MRNIIKTEFLKLKRYSVIKAGIIMATLSPLLSLFYSTANGGLLAPGAHSQFGSGKNTQFEPEQRANPFENVFSKTAVFPPPAIAETDL